jgi:hypothetical protein
MTTKQLIELVLSLSDDDNRLDEIEKIEEQIIELEKKVQELRTKLDILIYLS